MQDMSHLQYLSMTFTCSLKVTLPNTRKCLVKVTFPSPFQYLNGSLYKSLRSLKVYFHAVLVTGSPYQLGISGEAKCMYQTITPGNCVIGSVYL